MIKKDFVLNEKEYKEFSNHIMVKSKFNIVLITGLIVLIGTLCLSLNSGFEKAIVNAVFLFVVYMLIICIGLFGLTPLFTRKAYKKNGIANIEFKYEILDTGIKQNKDIYLYGQFIKAVEGKLSFFLYLQQKQIIVIPKRIFNKDELENFKELIKSKINKVKLKK